MSERYVIYKGSTSAHCCFVASVMDRSKPVIVGNKHYEKKGVKLYETVCECFEINDAVLIAKALNNLPQA